MTEPIVTIDQMQAIESRMFAAGMPVAALMEKVGGLISRRCQELFPRPSHPRIGVVAGTGHNGGDALVVARELHFRGYQVIIYSPSDRYKDLTAQHYQYATSLGIAQVDRVAALQDCNVIIDGLFGFGLNRHLSAELITIITEINALNLPIVSIDLSSGLQADTGQSLGATIQAQHTLCLGLWKRAFAQDLALPSLGQAELLSLDIPAADIQAVLGHSSPMQMITKPVAAQYLPHHRPLVTHKYQQGHLLLVVGSERYAGAAILAGLGAQASGVGMLSIAVPNSIKLAVLNHLPAAMIIGCPETAEGTIAQLPDLDWLKYTAIAGGCGLTTSPVATIQLLLAQQLPLLLDADALNILAQLPPAQWQQRASTTILTPHDGEWQRLFPAIMETVEPVDRLTIVMEKSQQTGTIILRKGARTIISDGTNTWVINNGTPALARGGSGDVLTGLISGLIANNSRAELLPTVASANWWHAQAGSIAAQERGIDGVDALTLSHYLHRVVAV